MKTFSMVVEKAQPHHQANIKQLNPKLWDDHRMKRDVRRDIVALSQLYAKELGLNQKDIEQVNAVGGNASYDWDKNSDLDLTMVLKPNAEMSRKRFKALAKLTSLINYQRHPSIRGIPTNVFLTLRGLNNPIREQSIFNVSQNQWVAEPQRKEENNQRLVMAKVKEFIEQIKAACDDDDLKCHRQLIQRIQAFRARGLKKTGEYSFANEVYRKLSRSGEVDKLKEHISDLTQRLYHFEQYGELPKRHNTDHVPLQESPLSLRGMEQFASYGNPTNVELWKECLYSAEEMLGGEHQSVVMAEALNQYYVSRGRWYMKYGEPSYVSVDIEKVAELSENTSKRMLQNISGKILAEMAASSYSISSRKVLSEQSRRGNDTSVGVIQQECVHGEGNTAMRCSCCGLKFYPNLLESIYRSKSFEEMEQTLQHIGSLQELLSLLEG